MSSPQSRSEETVARFPEYARTLDCVHCGLCIPHCPTHGVTGREADSPRGRIHLMRAFAENGEPLSEGAREHLDQCIVCRACESVCPSGIHMGEMMESFREQLNRSQPRGAARPLGRFFLQHLLPHRGRLSLLTDALDLYERTGLSKLVTKLLANSPDASRVHAMRPPLPPRSSRRVETDRKRPQGFRGEGDHRATVGLFLGCIASEWFAPVHRATIRVLQKNGCDVVIPDPQTCCGALHRHAGCLEDALSLEDRNRTAFQDVRVDAVIVNAAGCGASLKEPVIRDVESSVRYVDVCEYLHELGIRPPTRDVARKVAYDQPCHLVHGQKLGPEIVTDLLKLIPKIELVPLAGSERCCGAGGIYNLLHPEMAEPVLREKVRAIRASGAEIVVTGNPGCIMQIRAGLHGSKVEVLHPVELLDRAYGETTS